MDPGRGGGDPARPFERELAHVVVEVAPDGLEVLELARVGGAVFGDDAEPEGGRVGTHGAGMRGFEVFGSKGVEGGEQFRGARFQERGGVVAGGDGRIGDVEVREESLDGGDGFGDGARDHLGEESVGAGAVDDQLERRFCAGGRRPGELIVGHKGEEMEETFGRSFELGFRPRYGFGSRVQGGLHRVVHLRERRLGASQVRW